jgi:hypothetical protein
MICLPSLQYDRSAASMFSLGFSSFTMWSPLYNTRAVLLKSMDADCALLQLKFPSHTWLHISWHLIPRLLVLLLYCLLDDDILTGIKLCKTPPHQHSSAQRYNSIPHHYSPFLLILTSQYQISRVALPIDFEMLLCCMRLTIRTGDESDYIINVTCGNGAYGYFDLVYQTSISTERRDNGAFYAKEEGYMES